MRNLLMFLCIVFSIFCFVNLGLAQSDIVTEQNLKNAILGIGTFTIEELQALDVNNDSKVDVADLICFLDNPAPPSLTGEHVGIFFRDNANLFADQGEVLGQLPFALHIKSESPLEGEIDNSSAGDMGHYSLYFPDDLIPVTFTGYDETGMEFEFQFETLSPNLAPDSTLVRKMVFKGSFSENRRVLAGTYEEFISGFKDNRGADIPITLTGKFVLVFSN